MGNSNYKYGITLGENKKSSYLMLQDYYSNYKIPNDEIIALFQNDEEKEIASKILKFIDNNQSLFIDINELKNITDIVVKEYVPLCSDDVDNNLSDDEAIKLLQDNNIIQKDIKEDKCHKLLEQHVTINNKLLKLLGQAIPNMEQELTEIADYKQQIADVVKQTKIKNKTAASVFLKIFRYLTTKDNAIDIKSGTFKIDGEEKEFNISKLDEIDATGKTYKFTLKGNILDNILNNNADKTYVANFSAKDIKQKIMTSKIYAKFLENKNLQLSQITTSNSTAGTIMQELKSLNYDKDKKLAIDILLGNITEKGTLDYSNSFDTNKDGVKKSFTIIPTELMDIANNNYTLSDIRHSLKIIADLSNEDIKSMFEGEEDYAQQYQDTLIKRHNFCKNLLAELPKHNKQKSLKDIIAKAIINASNKSISELNDTKDINAYERANRLLCNDTLNEKIQEKKAILNSKIQPQAVNQVDINDIPVLNKIKSFGFSAVKDINTGKITIKFQDNDSQYFKQLNSKLNYNNIIKCINLREKIGVDVLKDKDTFLKFLVIEKNLARDINIDDENFYHNILEYDLNTYNVILSSFDKHLSNEDLKSIEQYKNNSKYKYFHEMLLANNELGEQILPELDKDTKLSSLSNLINKTSTPCDVVLYRGEDWSLLDNIKLNDGTKLEEKIHELGRHNTDTINKLLNELQNRTITQPKFISTSIDKNVADGFATRAGGFILKIHLPAGSKALCVDIFNHQVFEDGIEAEILLQRGSDIFIQGISFDEDYVQWIIDCTIETK